jgi:hypothetical protein
MSQKCFHSTLFGVISKECKPLLLFGIIIVNVKYADQDEFSGNAL